MKKQIVPLSVWAKKNNYSSRQVHRLAAEGKLPIEMIPTFIRGIDKNFKPEHICYEVKGHS